MGKRSLYIGTASNTDRPNHRAAPDDVDDDGYPVKNELMNWSVIEVRDRAMHEVFDAHHTMWTERDVYDEMYGHLDDDWRESHEAESSEPSGYSSRVADPSWGRFIGFSRITVR